ncbi:MAG: bile acid:sodium symporter [Candidatus Methylacidiphilales bacterium]|nr:bile acid:sodium symporter [Candidatus Methylacidiphilales bacterium]
MLEKWRGAATSLRPLWKFFAGLAVTLGLALFLPAWGAPGGWMHPGISGGWAVALIFLIQGLLLPAREVGRGLSAWPVHVFCLVWMFVVFPLMGAMLVALAGATLEPVHRVGLMFLCFLPTTVATNAAFSSRAGGNAAVALFNIVVGNIAGLFIAPAALVWLLHQDGGVRVHPAPLVNTILFQLVLPFALGQVLRTRLAGWAARHQSSLRESGSVLIFLIIYFSLCRLSADGHGTSSGAALGWLVGLTLGLLGVGSFLCWRALGCFHWPHDLRVAAFYAASQKTLAAGLPMAGAVYAAAPHVADLPPLAVLAVPLVVFHIGQLVLGALLIPVLAQGGDRP